MPDSSMNLHVILDAKSCHVRVYGQHDSKVHESLVESTANLRVKLQISESDINLTLVLI